MHRSFKMEHLTVKEAEALKQEILERTRDFRIEPMISLVVTKSYWDETEYKRKPMEMYVYVFTHYDEKDIPVIEELTRLFEAVS